jgi:AP-1 complex subunit mu
MSGGVSAIYILDARGKLLISREYRGDAPPGCVDRFVSLVTGTLAASTRAGKLQSG